jgi:hypothetical protein
MSKYIRKTSKNERWMQITEEIFHFARTETTLALKIETRDGM